MKKFNNKSAVLKAIRVVLNVSTDVPIGHKMLSSGCNWTVAKNAIQQSVEETLYRISNDLQYAVDWLNIAEDGYLYFVIDGQVYRNKFDFSKHRMVDYPNGFNELMAQSYTVIEVEFIEV